MPVDTLHQHYQAISGKWQRCGDVYDGSDAVKGRDNVTQQQFEMIGPLRNMAVYLPAPGGMDGFQYAAYKMRAQFYNAMKRTVQGLTGAIFRKEPTIQVPRVIEPQLADLTLTDRDAETVASQITSELLKLGRVGVLLDMPTAGTLDARPYWLVYVAQQICNWRIVNLNGRPMLDLLVLKEEQQTPGKDPFMLECTTRYRVIEVKGGKVEVTIYHKPEGAKEWLIVQGSQSILERRGEPLREIPFVCFGPNALGFAIDDPPLLDLVDVNLGHYRNSADYEHGLHWTGLPTPWVASADTQSELLIGSQTAWNLGMNGKAGMLEFTGQGLGALEKALEHKEEQMAILGARLLEGERSGQREAAETVRLRHSGEQASLRRLAGVVSLGMTIQLRRHVWWAGLDVNPEDVTCALNEDFYDVRLSGEELKALMLALQAEEISYETFYYNLERGEWARPGVSAEQEREAIVAGAAARSAALPPEPEPEPEDEDEDDDAAA